MGGAERPVSFRKFFAYVVLAGLLNATIVAFLICHLPAAREPSIRSLAIRAFLYVMFAAAAGVAGARFYWNRFSIPFKTDPPLSFSLYALGNASAWVWLPAIVLLSRQDSPASSAVSGVSAALLACGLRQVIPNAALPVNPVQRAADVERRQMFAATLGTAPRDADGYIIALSLYATGCLLFNHFYLIADTPLAIGAFLFAWNLTPEPPLTFKEARARAISRLALAAAGAILVTLFVLLSGIGHRNRLEAAILAHGNVMGDDTGQNRRHSAGPYSAAIYAYESVILWPIPYKKQIVAPVPASISPFAERAAKPLIIRFEGPYWYFQPPGTRPGPMAHEAHGNPLGVNIGANNFIPLNMEAVQNLGAPIRLARCRELQVTVENRDNLRGPDCSWPCTNGIACAGQAVALARRADGSLKRTKSIHCESDSGQ